MKDIFKATGGTDRTTVIGKAESRSTLIMPSMFPAVCSAVEQGKTLFIVVVNDKVKGVFNRLGQAYPLKSKDAKCGFAPLAALMNGFTPEADGVYQAVLVGEGLTRVKVKALVSLTRSAPFTPAQLSVCSESLSLVFTDLYTIDEFNGDIKKADSLATRLTALSVSITSGIKLKKSSQFKIGHAVVLNDYEAVAEFLANNGSLMVRSIPSPVKEAEKPVDKATDKPKKEGKGKKGKEAKPKDDDKKVKADSKAGKKVKKDKKPTEPVKSGKKKGKKGKK